jgi:aspartate aminotransferase-like enzyme
MNALTNLLPGPVNVPSSVQSCMQNMPFSHRIKPFNDLYQNIVDHAQAVGMPKVQVLQGNGTLANDVIANQLLGLKAKGIIIENGEFGKRLVRQANNVGLCFEVFNSALSAPIPLDQLQEKLQAKEIQWLWFVHCETSSGQLNPLQAIVQICQANRVICAVDAISSIGNLALDFTGASFVSATSGKGLSSFPGLCLVMYQSILNTQSISHFLDLAYHEKQHNIPFTLSSNQLEALVAGFNYSVNTDHYSAIEVLSVQIKTWHFENFQRLHVAQENPAVHTFMVKSGIDCTTIGNLLAQKDVMVNCYTKYLQEMNAFQICLMGAVDRIHMTDLKNTLHWIDHQCANQNQQTTIST